MGNAIELSGDFASKDWVYQQELSPAKIGGGFGCFREADRFVPPLRGGGFFSSVTMGVAMRHPWLLILHPSRMRQCRAMERMRNPGNSRIDFFVSIVSILK